MFNPPNIVLITVDSLRADQCGFIEGGSGVTPIMDNLAQRGYVFENAIAPGPRTPSSMSAIFAGEFLPINKLNSIEGYSDNWEKKQELIASHLVRHHPFFERLQRIGYNTAAVTTNPWTTSLSKFDKGFDIYYHGLGEGDAGRSGGLFYDLAGKVLNDDSWLITWTDIYDKILNIREQLSEPYLLWIFLLDPHEPYLVPRQYRHESSRLTMYYSLGMYYGPYRYRIPWLRKGPSDPIPDHVHSGLLKTYRDAIRSTDAFIGELLGDLKGDDPVTIVHADHGEAFYEHGTYGHLSQLYEENIHVPLLIHGTGDSGQVRDPISLRKLPNIVESIASQQPHLDYSSGHALSQTGFTRGGETSKTAVRGRRWKLILGEDDLELYDLVSDPNESINLVSDRPDVVDTLRCHVEHRHVHERETKAIEKALDKLRADI